MLLIDFILISYLYFDLVILLSQIYYIKGYIITLSQSNLECKSLLDFKAKEWVLARDPIADKKLSYNNGMGYILNINKKFILLSTI